MDYKVSQKKQDFSGKLTEIAENFIQFISDEFPEYFSYFSDTINENVIALLDIEKPKIMVYGIYNSGKSTLINSLCKEEVAEMADRPMTDQITEYDRGDYYLVDSPGVDAPIAHEMVTEEFINKCHIILFVISTKGLFEDRDNYIRLAKLIEKDIPFIIVLNDRGVAIKKEWSDEQKKRVKFDHEQELKIIQYKVIQNLIKESNDKKIADKYEVIVLNAKKALKGILENKPKLYDVSNVAFLDKRITQILQNDTSIKNLFKQPIGNIKESLNKIEKIITQTMSGNTSEDFAMRLHIMESKCDNIMKDLRVLTQQAVFSHLEELTNSYVMGDTDIFETIAGGIFSDVQDRCSAKVNELVVYIHKNFASLNLWIDNELNLEFDFNIHTRKTTVNFEETVKEENDNNMTFAGEIKGFFDFLKSRKKREAEKLERLEREAELKNQQAQYKVQEQIRKKQEARQLANCDLDELLRMVNTVVTKAMQEKYDDVLGQIQEIDCLNKMALEDGKRQMGILKRIREELLNIENQLG